jgi:tight adherence protein B
LIGPLLFGLLVGMSVVIAFAAVWRLTRNRDPVEARLTGYGGQGDAVSQDREAESSRPRLSGMTRLVNGFGLGPALAMYLTRADMPLTAAEFALIVIGTAMLGLVIGAWRGGLLLGAVLAVVGGMLPVLYLRRRAGRRKRDFTEQLPEVLTLLVGALRAGYGLNQALQMLVDEMPPPASVELGRVTRTVGLGLPVERALGAMADRIDSDDLTMVVTAMNVQHETGGNLAQTLEVIGETVRDRIRMFHEIRVLTAQQRFTGYVLAIFPFVVAVGIYFANPQYMRQLFLPGWPRLMPIGAVILQVLGFLIIRKIVDIEV